ncbi:hypothetical protein RCJ22_14285 [Vibrio sp. FNV 38]|nr:hypothetical protein [Vibrio sp. FNV 38]
MKFIQSIFILSALFTSTAYSQSEISQQPQKQQESATAPIVITGDDIQPLSDTHWRIKVSFSEAAKVRCVAFDKDEQPVSIDSIVVFPPFSVSNMYTRSNDGDITQVKCWVTSTRAEDLSNDYIRHKTS